MNELQRFCREGVAWKHLRHPNILPLIGVTVSNQRFAMVSAWMENGNINEFVEKDRHVNRIELVRDALDPSRTLIDSLSSWLMLQMAWDTCTTSTLSMGI